jgi:hypothetical protein
MGTFKFILLVVFSAGIATALIIWSGGKVSVVPPPSNFSISGKVTGAPGVSVILTGPATATVTTSADGTYAFAGLPNGDYVVTPTLAGYAFSQTSSVRTVSDADVIVPTFTATSATTTYSISGTAGVPGVTMALNGSDTSGSVLTGPGGTYTFVGVVPGSYTIIPALAGYIFNPNSLPVTIKSHSATANNFTPTAIKS